MNKEIFNDNATNPRYEDSDCIEQTISDDNTDIHLGQVWKDRRNKPTAVFVVLKIYTRSYQGKNEGKKRYRVSGVLSMDRMVKTNDDIDVESLRTMFPYLMFEPNMPEVIEDK